MLLKVKALKCQHHQEGLIDQNAGCKFLWLFNYAKIFDCCRFCYLFHKPCSLLCTRQNAIIRAESSSLTISLLHSYSWPLSSADKCHVNEIIIYFRASHCSMAIICSLRSLMKLGEKRMLMN